mgnify:FL=1|tara:strand:- start:67 stop:513 length:447 start_codon:yes stop_codon:yes gene_type:complete
MVKEWAPITWILLHTIAEKCNTHNYSNNRTILLKIIKEICSKLPCPECRFHAVQYMKKINVGHIPTKNDFIKLIFNFHNNVNKRLKKPIYNFRDLDKYRQANYINILRNFKYMWVSNSASRILSDQMTRRIMLKSIIKDLLNKNIISY